MTITLTALATRLHPLAWPETADPTGTTHAATHRRFSLARTVFEEYAAERAKNAGNPRLTPAGIAEANAAWATRNLPRLSKAVHEARTALESVEKGRADQIRAEVAPKPADAADAALMTEIRTYLRGLPDAQRSRKVQQLAEAGDRTALQAVLGAPAYLTGLDPEMTAAIADAVFAKAHPERDAAQQAFRAATEATVRALDGATAFIIAETDGNAYEPIRIAAGTFDVAVGDEPAEPRSDAAILAELRQKNAA